ncbi:uncharacterized protein LOC121845659 [Oncorhynchus tshawytscha]|uniref:uncharacterized protein LOC121845659 n=1 Tax=Oncorhynchus tshawytscha TaxID=74940 RepID=UPI001C3DFEE4|nr:uncharacterized protein LOC121845659 [Oncorhynchus tshawytscha]
MALIPERMRGKLQRRWLFLKELGKALVRSQIQRRQHIPRTPASAAIVRRIQDEDAHAPSTLPTELTTPITYGFIGLDTAFCRRENHTYCESRSELPKQLRYCSTRMNDSSGNHTYLDNWDVCLNQGYVVIILSCAAQVLCFILGFPALVWCLWLSLSGSLSGGLKPTHIFPINLFAVELVFCTEVLLQVFNYFIQNIMLEQAGFFLYIVSWTCRPLLQSCICVERYLAVAHPVAFLKYRRRRYRVACSIMVWVLTLAYASSLFLYFEETSGYVLIGVYCLGMAVISLCCFFILRVLKQPGPGEVEGGRGGEKKQGKTDPHKVRAFGIILTNLVIILASSITVVVGWATFSSSLDYNCNVFPMLLIVNIFSVMVSPLMHLYREGRLPCRRGPETR